MKITQKHQSLKIQVFSDSKHEKAVRGRLKSEVLEITCICLVMAFQVIKLLSREGVVVCDGLNYIKGFR